MSVFPNPTSSSSTTAGTLRPMNRSTWTMWAWLDCPSLKFFWKLCCEVWWAVSRRTVNIVLAAHCFSLPCLRWGSSTWTAAWTSWSRSWRSWIAIRRQTASSSSQPKRFSIPACREHKACLRQVRLHLAGQEVITWGLLCPEEVSVTR